MDLRIVPLTTLPLDGLTQLLNESEAQGMRLVRRLLDDWVSGENRFDRSGEALFGAYARDELVGVCGINVDPFVDRAGPPGARAIPARLRHLYVKASYRRHGVGRRLVAHSCRTAALHFRRVQLRTRSAEASLFYERLGFISERESETVTHSRALPSASTELLLIRHAESLPSDAPEPDWPLSTRGQAQARELAELLARQRIDRLLSSPYRRARDTLRPYAESRGLTIEVVPDLRERKLSDGVHPDWLALVRRAWSDFSFALPGCETSSACQRRVTRALERAVEFREGETLALASHGNAIGLFLNGLEPSFDFHAWRAMRNPEIFRIVWTEAGPRWHR